MTITLNGGSSDFHMISLNDMKKIADSIQKISYNFEYEVNRTKQKEIYIKANKEGSFEILLELLDPTNYQTIVEGVAAAYLYDLIKKMKTYVKSDKYKEDIKFLIDETYKIAIELAKEEYYDVKFKRKEQTIKENIKKINAEFSNYNSIKQLSSIVNNDNNQSLKPTSITFNYIKDNIEEVLEINASTKEIFENNDIKDIKVDNIIVSAIPDTPSRSNGSFYIDIPFIGKMKVRATDEELSRVSDYFGKKEPITVELEPIIKMGELVETRDSKLVRIIEA